MVLPLIKNKYGSDLVITDIICYLDRLKWKISAGLDILRRKNFELYLRNRKFLSPISLFLFSMVLTDSTSG